jgi:spore coat protein U-like protein
MNFGIYNPLSAIGNSITASWTVTCTAVGSGSASVAGSLALSTGSSGTYTSRTMRSGANVLNYNVYETPSNTVVYGDGTAGTFTPTAAGTVSAGQQYVVAGTFYGFVPPLQNVSPGSYSDVLVITVSY